MRLSHKTRKRAYRKRLDLQVAQWDEPTRIRFAENIIRQLSAANEDTAVTLRRSIESVGWTFSGDKLRRIGDSKSMKGSANLTDEQRSLLRTLVEAYNKGCRSEFIVTQAHGSPLTVVYIQHCHPN